MRISNIAKSAFILNLIKQDTGVFPDISLKCFKEIQKVLRKKK